MTRRFFLRGGRRTPRAEGGAGTSRAGPLGRGRAGPLGRGLGLRLSLGSLSQFLHPHGGKPRIRVRERHPA